MGKRKLYTNLSTLSTFLKVKNGCLHKMKTERLFCVERIKSEKNNLEEKNALTIKSSHYYEK